MSLFSDRRIILAGGGAAALVLGLGVAMILVSRAPRPKGPPPASRGGLVVEQGKDDGPVDPGRPLRCFVGGQMVGEMTLADFCGEVEILEQPVDAAAEAAGEGEHADS